MPVPNPSTDRKMSPLGILFGDLHQLIGVGHANIEIAVGAQDHTVGSADNEMVTGHFVGQLDALGTRRSTRLHAVGRVRRR